MPFKLTKTSSDILPWGRSVSFNTTSYISTPANAVFNPGNTGAWTLEAWFYPRATTSGRVVLLGNGLSWGHALQIAWGTTTTSKFTFQQQNGSTGVVWTGVSAASYALNTWYHLAVSKDGSNNIKCFINGVEETAISQTNITSTIATNNKLLVNSQFSNLGTGDGCDCFTSNVRWIKGTALYTASFTAPTSPFNVVANTSLLACHDTSIKDGSVNNFAITNNNSATVSTATPFVVSTKSVLFNGINQRLTVPNNAAFQFGTGDFTIECWMYCRDFGTLATTYNRILCVGSTFMLGTGTGAEFVIYASSSNTPGGVTYNLAGNTGNIGATISSGTSVMDTNRWYHLAMTRQSGTMYGFIDGGLLYSVNNTASVSGTSGVSIGGGLGATSYFSGSISNVRIVKGTALYTASFTAPTSPLTSVASCSLLTCNLPTIVDSSNNNFTITNNGSTVSSVVPFNAVGYGYKFKNVNNTSVAAGTQRAIFGYGYINSDPGVSITNLVSNTGIVATDTTGVGTARLALAAAGYGTDKAIFGYGYNGSANVSMTNKVSNTGVVSTDTTGVGTSRRQLAAAGYGTDKAIFGYGNRTGALSMTNLVSNTGVVATDTTGVGTARQGLAAVGYGTDKAIFGYGEVVTTKYSITNKVSNTGVVATDTTGVGTAREGLAAAGYGTDKAIFGYGYTSVNVSMTNKVSNTGVVSTDTTGVGTSRRQLAAAGYGTDKAIFGYGYTGVSVSMTNLVSNTGVVATDTTGVGTARQYLAAAGFSTAGPASSGMNFKKVYPDPIVVFGTQKAIFGYGNNGATNYSITNLVSNTGVVANDTTGVGTARNSLAAAGYGSNKAIFGYGLAGSNYSITNLVSNTGVVATDITGVGTARYDLAAAGYGTDKAIFGYGSGPTSLTNLVSNTGVVSTDTTGVGTSRSRLAAAGYGSDKAIFGYGFTTVNVSMTNLVSNTGVVATDTTGVGTARRGLAAAGYGSDKAIFGYGYTGAATAITNLVSNTGVVATDTTGVGTARYYLAAAGYGSDKAIFGYGQTNVALSMTNLVSNTGVVSTDTTGVGTARSGLAAAGYSLT